MGASRHVVFGAGQIGQPLAALLRAQGHDVRVARRSSGQVPAGVELVQGDALDPAFCRTAAAGATTIYHCMNPPYFASAWAEQLPRYMDNLIEAARESGAKLVVLENLYALGAPRGKKLNEDTPMAPVSRKGEIRARVDERLFTAQQKGEVVATLARASDFYGPHGTQSSLGDYFWPSVLKGKTAYSPFHVDAVHTYHYIPDVVEGLALLGTADASEYGGQWMLPCTEAGSLRDLVRRLEAATGRTLKVGEMPRLAVRALGLFMPIMRELNEMLYQWDEPFVVDDSRFRTRFGVKPTPVDEAVTATATWALAHYGRA